MTAATSHPEHDHLLRFGHGLLSAEERQCVEAHVTTCDECAARLTALDADSLAQLLRHGPVLATCPASTPLPSSAGGLTSSLHGLPAADSDEGVPEPLRNHPRYRVIRLLGRGGMGNVYLAEHRHMDRLVALKVIEPGLLSNPEAVKRFRQEAKAAARLTHPNVVQAFDADEAGGLHFLVLQYVEGESLASYAAKRGPLPPAEACEYARQAAVALQYAHDAGLVHRDVKPHNLMRTPDGVIKVLDFGLARVLARPGAEGSTTEYGSLMGTPDYVAPEQARDAASADGRADVYGLGCTLYHLLSGRPPFPGGTAVEKVARHLTEDVPALDAAGLPAGLAEVVARMTARQPERRYQTAGEAAAALAPFASPQTTPGSHHPPLAVTPAAEAVATGQTTILPPASPRSIRGRGRVRWGWAALVGFLGFAALAAGVVVYRIQTDKGEVVIETTDDDVEVVVKQGGKLVTIYDPKTKQKLILRSGTYELELKGKPSGLKLDLDKVTLRRDDKVIAKIQRLDPEIRQVRRFVGHTDCVCRVAFSSDGRRALSCGMDGTLRLWDVETGKQLRVIHPPVFRAITGSRQVHNVVFSADDRRALSASWDGTIRLWDVDSGKEVRAFMGHGHAVFRAIFSPDGRRAFSTSQDGTLRVWNVESGQELRRFHAPQDVAQVGLAVSPDGRRVFGGGHGDTILRLWEVDGGKEPRRFEGHKERITCVVFLSGGKRALSSSFDGTLRLWDVESGKECRCFTGHVGPVEDVAVTPDGRRAVSASHDGTVRLWDLESGRQLASFEGHVGEVVGCVISPDGRLALSAGADKTVRLLRLPDPPAARDRR